MVKPTFMSDEIAKEEGLSGSPLIPADHENKVQNRDVASEYLCFGDTLEQAEADYGRSLPLGPYNFARGRY